MTVPSEAQGEMFDPGNGDAKISVWKSADDLFVMSEDNEDALIVPLVSANAFVALIKKVLKAK